MVNFNFNIKRTNSKTIGGVKTGKPGRPKGCKLINKVNRNSESQKRFGHRNATTSKNKEKDTPIKHGYHLEDYNRKVAYLHFYDNEEKPFYVGTGTLQRAFVIGGTRRHSQYNDKVKDINLVKVKIIAIDISEEEGVQIEKEYCDKYGTIENGGCLVNVIFGGKGNSKQLKDFSKPIYQLDRYGNIVQEFKSIVEAARNLTLKYGFMFDGSQISKVCRGKAKSCKGLKFRYKEDNEI